MLDKPRVLLVNPWIYDFAAHNFWCEPLGLVSIGTVLRQKGCRISMLDCLYDPPDRPRANGTGRYQKVRIPKPALLHGVPRYYGRYGISDSVFEERMSDIAEPDAILVTSSMTYWYPGVFRAIRCLRVKWPTVPVVLGGTYATLCTEHARRYSGANIVVSGEAEGIIFEVLEQILTGGYSLPTPDFRRKLKPLSTAKAPAKEPSTPGSVRCPWKTQEYPGSEFAAVRTGLEDLPDLSDLPLPAHELRWKGLKPSPYIGIETSRGCPFRCTYCASHILHPRFCRRPAPSIVEEIEHYRRVWGIRHMAFFDDALLFEPETLFLPLMDEILKRGLDCSFHTPNGIHAREISLELARKMFRAGFRTLRLGLETSDQKRQLDTGGKISNERFARSVENLKQAGFTAKHLAAYILAGLPGQTVEEIEETFRFVQRQGVQVRLAEFSPIPYTEEAEKVGQGQGPVDIQDPLLHNNSICPVASFPNPLKEIERIKQKAREGNRQLLKGGRL